MTRLSKVQRVICSDPHGASVVVLVLKSKCLWFQWFGYSFLIYFLKYYEIHASFWPLWRYLKCAFKYLKQVKNYNVSIHLDMYVQKLTSYDHLWVRHSGQKCGALWPASPCSSTSPVSVSMSDVAVLETWRLWLEGIWKYILRRQHSSYHSSRHRCWFKPFFDSKQQEKPFFVWASWVISSYLPPRVLISSLFFFLGAYLPAACCLPDRPSWRCGDPLPFLPIPPLPLSRNVRIILHFSLSLPLHIQSDILWQF